MSAAAEELLDLPVHPSLRPKTPHSSLYFGRVNHPKP